MSAGLKEQTTSDLPEDDAGASKANGENLGAIVGQNIKRLRLRRNLSLEGLSKLCGVSRAMLGQVELGRSVPTINVVWKIANAFDVPFSTLIAAQPTEQMRVMRADQSKVLLSASREFSSRALFPFDGEHRVEFYEIRLAPGCVEEAEAHAIGTTENLVVVKGILEISVGDDAQRLSAGDAIVFQADKPHAYHNVSKTEVVAYLVMSYVEPER